MKRTVLILFLYSAFILLQAQEAKEGYVYDIGHREAIEQVEVHLLNNGVSSYSDANGYFLLDLPDENQNSVLNYYISRQGISWTSQQVKLIQLFSLNGSQIMNVHPQGNHVSIIPPPSGFYILVIDDEFSSHKFLIYSDGNQIYKRGKYDLSSFSSTKDTSLLFSRDDFYQREISISSERDTIFLLKRAYDTLDYFQELLRYEAFDMLQNSPPLSNFGEVQSIKVLYDFEHDEIYYSNINNHHSHFRFAQRFLDYEYSSTNFLYSQYTNHPSRFLNCFSINYHQNIDTYVMELSSLDMVDCEGIKETYEKVKETSYLDDQFYFYPNNLRWNECPDIPKISSEELFMGQNYQALNLEENYGYLRRVELDDLTDTYLGRHDLIILNGIPNDVSVVAGLITTEFQTPLSHINILSHNRQTPNMALKDAWDSPRFDSLMGQLVYLKVESDSFILRRSGLAEAEEFWAQKEPQNPVILSMDTTSQGLVDLAFEDIHSVDKIGGKAANFAELLSLDTIALPENYFAIPFYYYQQHLSQNGIDDFIIEMLEESKFHSDREYRKMRLLQLQNQIINYPLDENLIELVYEKVNHFNEFEAFRFRSSTNAEDLENFSGAGLYDSFSAKKDHPTKTIDRAIKKVWASLWNIRAYEERDYYKIDQNSIAMGVLVHRSFPNEDANGVVITSNLYSVNHAYTINTQYQDISIVCPEPGIFHDQILVYTMNLNQQDYTIEYLSQSNVPELNGETVLTNEELYLLADYCTLIKHHYFDHVAENTSCGYESFSVDIEFKIDSTVEERKLYIKQARIYQTYLDGLK